MKRGEVWWADLPAPEGTRPVLLLSRDGAYTVRSKLIVAPVTTRVRGIPAEVRLGPEDGLPKPCVVNLDVLETIPKACLRECITTLAVDRMAAVESAIRFALGMAPDRNGDPPEDQADERVRR